MFLEGVFIHRRRRVGNGCAEKTWPHGSTAGKNAFIEKLEALLGGGPNGKSRVPEKKKSKVFPELYGITLMNLLGRAIKNLDVGRAKKEVMSFVKNPEQTTAWSREFFLDISDRIICV